jgi:hemolysin activation/secretion protein
MWTSPPERIYSTLLALRQATLDGVAYNKGGRVARDLLRLCAVALVAIAWQAGAQEQKPLELRFDIARYLVEGNTLLPQRVIDRAVAPFQGKQRDFGDVQRAVEALQAAYRKAGYASVQVYLPEQELDGGVVTLRVVEARVASVSVTGNKHFDEANIRRSVPALAPGKPPSAPRIADGTQLANENPAKKVQVVLRPSGRPNEVDAAIEVEDEKPWKLFLTADNTGTPDTGEARVGAGFQHNNLFNRDHTVTGQYITSPSELDSVSVYSLGYRLPLYSLGDSIDLIAGYSDVDAGTTQTQAGPLAFSGQGSVALARYNLLLRRRGEYQHRFIFGADYRLYDNTCEVGELGATGCGPAAVDVAVHPVSLAYAGTLTRTRSQLAFDAAVLHNIPGGEDGEEEDIEAARPGAKGDYTLLRGGANLALSLWRDFQPRIRFNGQYTSDALVPGEQFGIGGWNSVRGFLEREVSSDKGYALSGELYTPDLLWVFGTKWGELRLLAFYDYGQITRNDPQPGDIERLSISSAGGGLRLSVQKRAALRADLAYVINGDGVRDDGVACARRGGGRAGRRAAATAAAGPAGTRAAALAGDPQRTTAALRAERRGGRTRSGQPGCDPRRGGPARGGCPDRAVEPLVSAHRSLPRARAAVHRRRGARAAHADRGDQGTGAGGTHRCDRGGPRPRPRPGGQRRRPRRPSGRPVADPCPPRRGATR